MLLERVKCFCPGPWCIVFHCTRALGQDQEGEWGWKSRPYSRLSHRHITPESLWGPCGQTQGTSRSPARMELLPRAQVCGDFARCDYGLRYPFSSNKSRAVGCEGRGKWHEWLIVGVCFPPRGFFRLLRKRPSSKPESQVSLRIKYHGRGKQGKCRINISLSVFQKGKQPLWLQDVERPLSATRKKNLTQKTRDRDSSDEDQDNG